MTFIHKLPFRVPRSVEVIEVFALERIVNDFYQGVNEMQILLLDTKGDIMRETCLWALVYPF